MNDPLLWILLIFVAVILIGFFAFRASGKAKIKAGPVSMEYEGTNHQPAAPLPSTPSELAPTSPLDVEVTNLKSAKGGALIEDTAGGRVKVDQVETQDDIIVSRSNQNPGTAPKA